MVVVAEEAEVQADSGATELVVAVVIAAVASCRQQPVHIASC
jgi:hypothetical protein